MQSAANTTGNVVSTLGDGVANGVGKLATDPKGLTTTVASVGGVVTDVGNGVSDLSGKLATATGSVPVVGGVVTKVAPLLDGVGEKVTMLGNTLDTTLTTRPDQPIDQQARR